MEELDEGTEPSSLDSRCETDCALAGLDQFESSASACIRLRRKLVVVESRTCVVGKMLSPVLSVRFGHGVLQVCNESDEFRPLSHDTLFALGRSAVADFVPDHAE